MHNLDPVLGNRNDIIDIYAVDKNFKVIERVLQGIEQKISELERSIMWLKNETSDLRVLIDRLEK